MIRANVILAVTKRNFSSYFSSILGYLFIIVFCVAASAMAFNVQFFAANQANLDQLSQQFPLLLLFLIPAITMTAWSDERKLGTDELLFTLPATEVEILLGKYLSVLGVYTVAVLCSLINFMILTLLGDPDAGLIFSSYFGYWLAGASLLAVGMLASALTNSATVAFVLGVVFCCIPVFVGNFVGLIEWLLMQFGWSGRLYEFRTAVEGLSLQAQLQDFSLGVIPLSSLCYFIFLAVLALYLNLVVICKRRWSASSTTNMSLQYGARTVSLAVIFVSVLVITNLFPARADLTAENLFSLSDATYETLEEVGDQQITVQAFVSPEVPREYSETRRQLLGLLREFDLRGGGNLEVRIVDVEPFSEEAEQARALGINPFRVQYEQDGKAEEAEVFLGAVVQSAGDSVEIQFDKGIPIEYELTRSVRTVGKQGRLTVGVLQTDANVMGGVGGRSWEIVNELRKQYDVINVNPNQKILVSDDAKEDDADDSEDEDEDEDDEPSEDFDLLLAVMPSSLTQPQLDNFMEYVESGKPVLIFDDVFPGFNPALAPKLPKPTPGGPMAMFQQQQRPEPKGDGGNLTSLCNYLDIQWDSGACVFDRANPHSEFSYLRPEVFFISRSGNQKQAFSSESPITDSLQDVVCMFAGTVQDAAKEKDREFIPLLQTSGESGVMEWEDYTEQSFNPFVQGPPVNVRENPPRFDDKYSHVIAAHIINKSDDKPANVLFCADTDIIGDQFFSLRARQPFDVEFDNVTFVLNAVDTLVGDEVFIDLRSRRSTMRTLQYVENQTRDLRRKLSAMEKDADERIRERLKEAREELEQEIEDLEKRDDLDPRSKAQLLAQKQEQLNKQLADEERELEREKNDEIRKASLNMKREIRRVENRVRLVAWIVPAILPICFGLLFLGLRNLSEKQSITAERRRR
jgi:ABC-2 type transport system permease protein